ncbi:1-acyl-sn-glycerol-3-phosphate acyltransferase [Sinimarinibacterium sp. CAU 1509]|uniref:lysophospholipid acyltransferase family protein n=1 Tax=Sinimarinibacterium sp. CAU 1509 TaxID=2562283 RepID=UPI0010AD286C|nr:lysophospholipid acyltransferase family protein [Sinimarinibacterium sp. CAU 1509]TJY62932.1 1-acyl-sn-glycerol-3-phosphate acyltransferase [Sinimarinibacterium sp. CAU 1509]
MTGLLRERIYPALAAPMLVIAAFFVCLMVIIGPTLAIRRELGRIGVRLMLGCMGVRLRVYDTKHVLRRHCIVVSNHASYLDGLVLTAALPRQYTFVVQDGAASWPLVGLTLRRMGVVFVNRAAARESARLTRQLMRRLHAGEPLAIFAEGTFKAEPGLLPFKAGAFLMAARENVPVVPAAITGTRRVYGGGRKLPRWSPIEVRFRPARYPDGTDRDAALRLREEVRREVLALCGESDRAPLEPSPQSELAA